MDFILLPDTVTSHEPVPDLGGPDFDNQGFLGYDQRQGWNVKAIRNGDILRARNDWDEYIPKLFKDIPPEEEPEGESYIQVVVGHFIQTWLLFGILQEALRRPVFRHEVSVSATVTHKDSDGKVISRKSITVRHLFGEFVKKRDALKADSPWAAHLFRCLRETAWILMDLDRLWEPLGSTLCPCPFTWLFRYWYRRSLITASYSATNLWIQRIITSASAHL
jgi:hypothetical protein